LLGFLGVSSAAERPPKINRFRFADPWRTLVIKCRHPQTDRWPVLHAGHRLRAVGAARQASHDESIDRVEFYTKRRRFESTLAACRTYSGG
jgi:hypothetical protein